MKREAQDIRWRGCVCGSCRSSHGTSCGLLGVAVKAVWACLGVLGRAWIGVLAAHAVCGLRSRISATVRYQEHPHLHRSVTWKLSELGGEPKLTVKGIVAWDC